jgi:hypothetical protein
MEREFFINSIKKLRDSSGEAVIETLDSPPGRKPRASDLENSEFYHSLTTLQKEMLLKIIYESVDMGLFSFLCILDHVHFIEDTKEKTTFELYAVKDGERVLLNDFNDEPLHDMFNSLVLSD